jgi:hypothetical protein
MRDKIDRMGCRKMEGQRISVGIGGLHGIRKLTIPADIQDGVPDRELRAAVGVCHVKRGDPGKTDDPIANGTTGRRTHARGRRGILVIHIIGNGQDVFQGDRPAAVGHTGGIRQIGGKQAHICMIIMTGITGGSREINTGIYYARDFDGGIQNQGIETGRVIYISRVCHSQ